MKGFSRHRTPLWLLLVVPALSGCLASFQTARPVTLGAFRTHVGLGISTSSSLTGTSTSSSANKVLDVGVRFGLGRSSDLGLLISLPTLNFSLPTVLLDFKFGLVTTQRFVLSLTLGPAYSAPDLGGSRGSLVAITGGLLAGYDFNDYFGLTLGVRDITPLVFSAGGTTTLGIGSMLAIPLTLRIGDTFGGFLEGSYLKSLSSGGSDSFLVGAAFFVGTARAMRRQLGRDGRAEDFAERMKSRSNPSPRRSGRMASGRNARVVKVKQGAGKALVSQPMGSAFWRSGERVCVYEGEQEVTCGNVTKSDATGAVLEFSPSAQVIPGQTVSVLPPPQEASTSPAPAAPAPEKDDLMDLEGEPLID